jgi:NADH-quinone oxidoreductase subunit G
MPTIFVDDRPYEVRAGRNLLEACLSLGFNIPYFCWHPAMHSVGACRMCAVKVFRGPEDTKGMLAMSCVTEVSDGMRVSIDDPEAAAFREHNIEWLMLNHPHDCPVCDEGGECHLQDMTLLARHAYRRTRFPKRTHLDQELGPFVRQEMNRCIQCYRCVRFYRDYAGGRDFNVFSWHNRVFFGRYRSGTLESPFAGNLVEVCPTGVFTDKTYYRHYTRKWDLQSAPSICPHCGLGCNVIAAEHMGLLRRIRNRFNGAVNGYFICDRGRGGYEFVNSPRRIREASIRARGGQRARTSVGEGIEAVARAIEHGTVIGIGSPRASLESNFALRSLVGEDRFSSGLSRAEHACLSRIVETLRDGRVKGASLAEAAACDAVLVLGEDPTNTAPMLDYSIRQSVLRAPRAEAEASGIAAWNDNPVRDAIQQDKGPLYIAAAGRTGLDGVARETFVAAPAEVALLGFAVAHRIDIGAPEAPGLSPAAASLAERIAGDLTAAAHPLVVAGASLASTAIIEAAANVAEALRSRNDGVRLCFVVPECDTLGVALLGGAALEDLVGAVERRSVETIIVIENDIRRGLGPALADRLFDRARTVIAIDSIETGTVERSDIVLPAATFAESSGTFVNSEGRAQRFFRAMPPEGAVQESWKWIRDVMLVCKLSRAERWENLDGIVRDMASAHPALGGVAECAPPADFRAAGQKIPRQSHRSSGRTSLRADIDVEEFPPPEDDDSALAFTMEGYPGRPPASLLTHYWAPHWNSVQALDKYQTEVGGPMIGGDPGTRLVEPAGVRAKRYFDAAPGPFAREEGSLLIVPSRHIFGSEELSALSPSVESVSARPFIAVNAASASELEVDSDGAVEVPLSGTLFRLTLKIDDAVPRGLAIVPAGLRGLPWDGVPVRWPHRAGGR